MTLTLKHNGSVVDLAAARCELGSLVRSLREPDSLTLRRARRKMRVLGGGGSSRSRLGRK